MIQLGVQWLARDWRWSIGDYNAGWPTLWLTLHPHLSTDPAGLAALTGLVRRWLVHPDSQDDPNRPAVEAALGASRVNAPK